MESTNKCVVRSCRNINGISNSSFFAVPHATHNNMRKWKQFMSLSGERKERICEEHFVPTDFIKHERLKLKETAVPSEKLPTDGLKFRVTGLCCVRRCCTKAVKILEHFPKKKIMLRKWQRALDIDAHIDTTHAMICRRHFKAHDFCKVTSKYLKTSAIPSKKVVRLVRLPKRFRKKEALPVYLRDHNYTKFVPSAKHVRQCSVIGCQSEASDKISLHSFPKKKTQRYKQWLRVLKYTIEPTISSKVCSLHFMKKDYMPGGKRLSPTAVPSVKLPIGVVQRTAWDIVCGNDLLLTSSSDSTTEIEDNEKNSSNVSTEDASSKDSNVEHTGIRAKAEDESVLGSIDNDQTVLDKGESYNATRSITRDCAVQTDAMEDQEKVPPIVQEAMDCIKYREATTLSDLLISDKDVRIWTGLQTLALLQEICLAVRKLEDVVPSKKFKLHATDRVILSFTKLKQNISFEALATLYRTSSVSVSTYFTNTIQIIAFVMKKFIYRPSKEEIRENIPLAFRPQFGNVTLILDCTEVPVASLKCLNCRIACYSNYKSRRTVKFLVGVTPAGLISFVSAVYSGKASDKFIFNDEKLIDSLEPHVDELMVDKGVSIEKECTDKCIKLHMPPFLRSERLTPAEATRNETIARARIHVERAIQRIKIFKILNDNINVSTLGLIDDIIVTVCAVVNLSPPIMKDDKF